MAVHESSRERVIKELHAEPLPSRPPPPLGVSVGPNLSHHKARVQAVGRPPVGSQEMGRRAFAAPIPPPGEKGNVWYNLCSLMPGEKG